MGFLINAPNDQQAIPKLYEYYTESLGIGVMTLILGAPDLKIGNGKSSLAVRLGELLDPHFGDEIAETYLHEPLEMLKRFSYLRQHKGKSRVVILDEPEHGMSSDRWYTDMNKAAADSLMTFRNTKAKLFLAMPFLYLIQAKLAKLAPIALMPRLCRTEGDEKVELRVEVYQLYTDFYGKVLHHKKFAYWNTTIGKVRKPDYFLASRASPEIIKKFEEVDDAYKIEHEEKTIIQLQKTREKEEAETRFLKINYGTIADELVQNETCQEELARTGKISWMSIRLLKPELSRNDALIVGKAITRAYKMQLRTWKDAGEVKTVGRIW